MKKTKHKKKMEIVENRIKGKTVSFTFIENNTVYHDIHKYKNGIRKHYQIQKNENINRVFREVLIVKKGKFILDDMISLKRKKK